MNKDDILDKLKRNCEIRGIVFSEETYEDEIDNAIEVVNERRGYYATEEQPFETKYSNLIYKMALYAISKMGAEGETKHSENGTDRTYSSASDYPNELLNQIIPKVNSYKR